MNHLSCDVIMDLLPLYTEGMLREETATVVKKHLTYCKDCQEYLKELTQEHSVPLEVNTEPLESIKQKIKRNKRFAVIFASLLTILVSVLSALFLTAPDYLPYSEATIQVNNTSNGMVSIAFGEEVAGYKVSSEPSEEGSGEIYRIQTWSTTLSDVISDEKKEPIILNKADQVNQIYYTLPNHVDQLIYGEKAEKVEQTVVLPRLVLNYYKLIAISILILGLIILYLVRSYEKWYMRIKTFIYLPISYLLAQFMVVGWDGRTYSLVRDFSAILLITLLIYGIILIVMNNRYGVNIRKWV